MTTDDTWREWVWHVLGCHATCDGHGGCICTCHEAREETA